MTERILHVSDLHLGRREAPEPVAALRELADRLRPELVLATGDLSHRGRRAELERAADMLRGLGPPLLAVPGNHDIPHSFPGRFTRTFREWERSFGTITPVHASGRLFVVGLSSVRPWRQQGGALDGDALAEAALRFREAPSGVLRVAAFHHQLAAPPWRTFRKRPLSRRDAVLQILATAGVELVAGGHVHQASVAERREFEALEEGIRRPVVLTTVPGLGRPRPRRRGEARGVNVYEVDEGTLAVVTFAWDGSTFSEVRRSSFPRG